jgi:hypothetical protein
LVSQKSREYVEMLIEHVSQSIQTKHMMDTSLNDKVLMVEDREQLHMRLEGRKKRNSTIEKIEDKKSWNSQKRSQFL